VSISLVLSAWPWLLVKSIPRLQRSLGPWIIGSRASRHQGFWIPFFLDTLSPSLPGLLVSWCLVSSASRFLYAKFSMSKVAVIPIFQVSERPEAHRHQPGTAALVPWSHDTPFPRFVIPLFSGFQVSESSSSQVPKFLRVAGSPTVVILHGSKVRTFPASLVSGPPRFAGTLLIEVYRQSRLLGQHALSIRLASRLRGSRPAMMAQATWTLKQLGFKVSS